MWTARRALVIHWQTPYKSAFAWIDLTITGAVLGFVWVLWINAGCFVKGEMNRSMTVNVLCDKSVEQAILTDVHTPEPCLYVATVRSKHGCPLL